MEGNKPYTDPIAALLCLIILGGLVALLNLFAIVVLVVSSRRSKNPSYPLLWLLGANTLIGLFSLPMYGLKKYNFKSPSVASNICDAWRYTYFTTIHIAMASLLIMTLDKVIHLQFPLRYPNIITKVRLNICITLAWIFFIFFDMIPFFPVNETDEENCHYYVKKKWALAMNILTMAIPLPIIVVSYLHIMCLAFKQANRVPSGSRKRKRSIVDNIKVAVEVKATKKVSYIVTAYMICWLPSTIYYLLEWVCPKCYPNNYQPHKTWIRFFFKLLVMCHGLVTPILFCWQSKIFRKNVRRYTSRRSDNSEISSFSDTKKTSVTSNSRSV